uniref:Ubiquitin-like protease family profile domain-containing protein n=1 Tax=Aegilops tauschii TaxID=37682 RepID=M8C5L3_AEGTA
MASVNKASVNKATTTREKKLKIHLEDVVNIMDLPSAGGIPDIKLRYADKKLESERKQKQAQLFRLYVNPKEQAITYKGLVQQIRESKGSTDEHFLRRIALCAICRLLCPSTKSQVSSEYLNLMLDDSDVNKINWATLTLDHLIASFKQYKNNKQTNLAGNLALLQVWYWEKFYVNKVKHNIDIEYSPRQKPLIQSWDKEKVAKKEKASFAEGDANKFVLPDISDEEIEPFCKKGNKCTWHKGQHKRHEEGESEHDEDKGESEHDEEQRESREHDSKTPAKRQQGLSGTNLGDEDDTSSKANGTVRRSNRKSKTNKEDEYSYYDHEKRQLRGLKETLQWVNRQDDKTPLAQIAEITLKKSSLHSLTANKLPDNDARYVDSLAIDAGIYINRPPEGEFDIRDGKKIFVESTINVQKLVADIENHCIARSSRIDKAHSIERIIAYLDHDMIFLPLNSGLHWYLAALDAAEREVQILNSAPGVGPTDELDHALEAITAWFQKAEERIKQLPNPTNWPDFNVASWNKTTIKGLPTQKDGYTRSSKDIDMYRRQLAHDILNSDRNSLRKKQQPDQTKAIPEDGVSTKKERGPGRAPGIYLHGRYGFRIDIRLKSNILPFAQ